MEGTEYSLVQMIVKGEIEEYCDTQTCKIQVTNTPSTTFYHDLGKRIWEAYMANPNSYFEIEKKP